jgi:hypothetical protein
MRQSPLSVPEHARTRIDPSFVDRAKLEADLHHAIVGEVRFDSATRGLYSTD